MPNNIAGSETCLLVMRVIKLSQNIKQTDSFEKSEITYNREGKINISGINWHFPAKFVLVKVYIYF